MPFKGRDGTALSARIAGAADAPPIVLIHGMSLSSLVFANQLCGSLAEAFRLIAPDLRGHGMSEVGPSLDAFADPAVWAGDLSAAIDAFASAPPLLVGWSFGGRVACAYLEGGGTAAGVVFVDAITMDLLPDGDRPHGPAASVLKDMAHPDDAIAGPATVAFVDQMTATPLSTGMRDMLLVSAAAVTRPVRKALRGLKSDHSELLKTLDFPVLAMHGEDDPLIVPAASEATAAAALSSTVEILPGVGHAPFLEDPAGFDARIFSLAHELWPSIVQSPSG